MESDTKSSKKSCRSIKKAKHKHKKHKKEKKHKEKQQSDSDEVDRVQLGEHQSNTEETFGPALPPHLIKQTTSHIIGPIIPPVYLNRNEEKDNENTDTDTYGPLPTSEGHIDVKRMELEERALQLKMAAIDGVFPSGTSSIENIREEWMLELPDVGLKTGLAALANMKRGFYQGKNKPDFSDRSAWTNTPDTDPSKAGRPSTSKEIQKSLQKEADIRHRKLYDEEQEVAAKKHKKKHKREESLVDLHQKKLRKERKEREKSLKDGNSKPERRPFSRDVDLKLNIIDRQLTKQIVDKAKILNTKFSTGQTKYL